MKSCGETNLWTQRVKEAGEAKRPGAISQASVAQIPRGPRNGSDAENH